STRGSGGRKRGRGARRPLLAKEPDSLEALCAVGRPQDATSETVDRDRDEQVERDVLKERAHENVPRGRRIAEHEVQDQGTEGVQERDNGDGEKGGVRAVAPGRLAVAPGPVADQRQQE